MRSGKNTFHYGWLILLICMVNVIISHGISSSFSVIFVRLLQEYDLGRAQLSGVFSVFMLIFFCGGILVGPLLDNISPRILIPAGSVIAGLGLIGCSNVTTHHALFFYYGIITATGVCCMSWVPNSVIPANWFPGNRGAAVGLVMCGSGIAMLLFIPLAHMLIEWAGWRGAFRALAFITVLAVTPLNAVFQRIRPAFSSVITGDENIAIGNSGSEENNGKAGWTLFQMTLQRRFWMMCLASVFNPFFTFSIVLHQVALLVSHGYDPAAAAGRLWVVGVFTVVGRLGSGALSDRIGREPAYTLFMSSAALGLVSLFLSSPGRPWALSAYLVFGGMGLGVGGALFPAMLADIYPGRSLGGIVGVISFFSGLGACLGSWLTGYSYDITGSYNLGLAFLFIAVWAAVFCVWRAAPRKGGIRIDSERS